jgi:predicted nuclease of predicted toxin-antitoxin system
MAGLLRAAGHDCAHVYDLGLGGQPDEQIMVLADRENRILVSADTDFGELLANRGGDAASGRRGGWLPWVRSRR